MKIRQIAGFVLLTAAVSGGALASTKSDAPVTGVAVSVGYADLNVSAPAGIKVLQDRIKAAANQVCGANEGRVPVRLQIDRQACVADAVESTMSEIKDAAVADIHMS